MLPRIEYCRRKGHKTHKDDVGKHTARKGCREVKGFRIFGKARGDHPDNERRADNTQHAHGKNRNRQKAENMRDEFFAPLFPFFFPHIA